ncbi:LacI family DNA-binding transcriptional regulator, partial [Alloscardovia theropitheci]|uniref:LacI family DNA-binding transcriptional regulator n=1 Tax=Alloscardovia theropitheci TaxID=2496842 RepID=UPI001F0E13FE
KGHIAPATRRLVQTAAKELGYIKIENSRKSSSGLIGLITSDFIGRFSLPLLTGAETTLGASNHAALLMSSHGKPSIEQRHINLIASYGVDGLIVAGDTANPRAPLPENVTQGLPTVYTYDPSTDASDCSVVCDNRGAGRQAIEYLINLGKRHIAIISGSDTFQASRDRQQGAMDAFRMYDMQPLAVINDRWSEEWGYRASHWLLDRYPHLDAVYCLSDEIARGACSGFAVRDYHVPSQVAVIGHDNWEVFSTGMHPMLTTFDNNISLLGKKAARLLLDALNGEPHHGIHTVECSLIIRESTDPHKRMRLRGSGSLTGLERY